MKEKGLLIAVYIMIVIVAVGVVALYKQQRVMRTEISEVQLPSTIYNYMMSKYTGEENEIVICLQGDVINNSLVVNNYYEPSVVTTDEHSAVINNCLDKKHFYNSYFKTIAVVHSHPEGLCYLSRQDLFTFGRMNIAISGVICESGNINFFSQNNIEQKIEYKVI